MLLSLSMHCLSQQHKKKPSSQKFNQNFGFPKEFCKSVSQILIWVVYFPQDVQFIYISALRELVCMLLFWGWILLGFFLFLPFCCLLTPAFMHNNFFDSLGAEHFAQGKMVLAVFGILHVILNREGKD